MCWSRKPLTGCESKNCVARWEWLPFRLLVLLSFRPRGLLMFFFTVGKSIQRSTARGSCYSKITKTKDIHATHSFSQVIIQKTSRTGKPCFFFFVKKTFLPKKKKKQNPKKAYDSTYHFQPRPRLGDPLFAHGNGSQWHVGEPAESSLGLSIFFLPFSTVFWGFLWFY